LTDIGIVQNPMFGNGTPGRWAALLPAYGPSRMMIDGAFATSFHTGGAPLGALAWLAARSHSRSRSDEPSVRTYAETPARLHAPRSGELPALHVAGGGGRRVPDGQTCGNPVAALRDYADAPTEDRS
jgi:hypothetical protein